MTANLFNSNDLEGILSEITDNFIDFYVKPVKNASKAIKEFVFNPKAYGWGALYGLGFGAYNFILNAIDNDNKIVIGAGLNGDFKRKPFGEILSLIPLSEKILYLSALCKKCGDGTAAHFTKILENVNPTGEQIIVGSNDLFESVCRKHYAF